MYLIPIQLFVFSRVPRLARTVRGRTPLVLGVVAYYAAVMFIWLNFAVHAEYWLPYPVSYTHLDVYKRQSMACAISAISTDQALRERLVARGAARVSDFDFDILAREMAALYRMTAGYA